MDNATEDTDDEFFGDDQGFLASFSFADTVERMFALLTRPFARVSAVTSADTVERIFGFLAERLTWIQSNSSTPTSAADKENYSMVVSVRWRLANASEAVVERFFWCLEFVDWLIQASFRVLLFLISPWRWFKKRPKRPVSDPWN